MTTNEILYKIKQVGFIKMVMPSLDLMHSLSEQESRVATSTKYEALTPTELEPDRAKNYIDALNLSFTQPDIRNIAVTGPYGAGKSSVLKTWCKTRSPSFRVLTVLLADFEMQKSAENSDTVINGGNEANSGGDKNSSGIVDKSIEYSTLQ